MLTAFGSGKSAEVTNTGPAPTARLLPAGPPRAQIVALQDTLRLQLPINQSRVTAIGYHSSGASTLALDPIGTQANAGLLKRMVNRFFGDPSSGIRYYQISGGVGPETAGRRRRADRHRRLHPGGRKRDGRLDPIRTGRRTASDGHPASATRGRRHADQPRPDPALTVGMTVPAGRTKIGQ
jgi:hypothetical protein